jgi:cyclohexanecarboxylate-CoA ligase
VLGHQERFAREWMRRGLWRGQTIAAALLETATRLPEKTAVVDGAVRLSFAALATRALAVARRLRSLGIGAGDTVAYQLPNWAETVILAHAVTSVGAIANPVPPIYRERETGFILREARARAVFVPGTSCGAECRQTITALRSSLPDLAHVVLVRDGTDGALDLAGLESAVAPSGMIGMAGSGALRRAAQEQRKAGSSAALEPARADTAQHRAIEAGRGEAELASGDADAVALLIYTSGTTADPKGVLHTHNTLLAEAWSLQSVHGLTSADTVLMPSPLTHISGIIHAILVPAALGTTAVLMERWDPTVARETIAREGVTYMVGPPVFVHDLCRATGPRPGRLRLFSCGGADVTPEVIAMAERELGCVAKRVYGSTEFPTLTTTGPQDAPEKRRETEGRAIGGAELRVVDERGAACPPGVEGEIVARGPECCVGYRTATLDAEAFGADGWLRTGDLGVLDADGYLRITGRKKEIIIRKGENISARELEEILANHPDVAEIAVIGVPDAETGERACAVVLPRPGRHPTLDALTGFLRARGLSTRKLPERLELVADFPRTASGKIHKAALHRQIGQADGPTDSVRGRGGGG